MEIFNRILLIINNVVIVLFTVSLALQLLYILLCFLRPKRFKDTDERKRLGIIICAKNEEKVIGETISNLFKQNYPKDKFDIFVVADNCTDNTAKIAREAGATVFERFDDDVSHHRVSYALKFLFEKILAEYDVYDAFIRFDADNYVHPDYFLAMNRALCSGVKIAGGYTNSKNLTENVVSCISGLWYMRESRFSANARSALRLSHIVPGAGMTFSSEIIHKNGGWIDMGYTEDADFTLRELNNGNKSEYISDAMLYEDQPTTLRDTFRRIMRIGRGLVYTFRKHAIRSLGKFFTTFKFAYLDMFLTEMFIPLSVVAVIWFPFYYIYTSVFNILSQDLASFYLLLDTLWKIMIFAFILPFILQAILVVILERKRIIQNSKKTIVLGILLFPIFMIFYAVGITLGVLFKPKWKQITRSDAGQSFSLAENDVPLQDVADIAQNSDTKTQNSDTETQNNDTETQSSDTENENIEIDA